MKVRTRLVLAFAYILLTVIIALTVPLAINLRKRAAAELTSQALQNAQNIAAAVGAESLPSTPGAPPPARLVRLVQRYSQQLQGRVIVMNSDGIVLVDEGGAYLAESAPAVGQDYFTQTRPEIMSALGQKTALAEIRFSDTLGRDIMVAAAPVIDEGQLHGAVRISTDVQRVTDSVRRITIAVILIGATGLLAGLVIAFALAGSLARPLTTLAGAARRLGAGDLSSRAGKIEGASEIRDLARSFDEMADRLEHTVQAQREFVANASHQLRTPLTGMKLRIETARNEAPTEEVRKQLEAADREVDRLTQIVDRLLTMAHQIEMGQPIRVDLDDAAARGVERWRERADRAGATLEATGSGVPAQANPHDLDQILDNLIDNAIAYAPGPIRVEAGSAGGLVFIAVQDSGPGIAREERTRVTDRFYRGRGAPAGGSGLGLAIARQLAEKWGGSLEVADAEGGGARIEVSLRPAEDEPIDDRGQP